MAVGLGSVEPIVGVGLLVLTVGLGLPVLGVGVGDRRTVPPPLFPPAEVGCIVAVGVKDGVAVGEASRLGLTLVVGVAPTRGEISSAELESNNTVTSAHPHKKVSAIIPAAISIIFLFEFIAGFVCAACSALAA